MSRAQQATDRAAEFIIAQEDGEWDDASQAQLGAWLAACDGNKAAYWRIKHSWRKADRIGALGPARTPARTAAWRTEGRGWWAFAAMAASIAVVIGAVFEPWRTPAAPSAAQIAQYETPVGGRKIVALSDGTQIQLNTASRVRSAVNAERREVWLDSGEAFFEVVPRDGAPFVVYAGDRRITVLGTKFSVRRDGDKVEVAVLEGRVRVEKLEGDRPVRSAVIVGGDIALAEHAAMLVTTGSAQSVENALAWRQGMLEFDQTPLSDVAAEFNRYNVTQMIVTDPDARRFRIGGMFPASDPEAFVRLLRDAYGMQVVKTGEEIKISS